MHDLALVDPSGHAILHRALEDAAEPLDAPSLADARQRRVIRQSFFQAEPGEPADCEAHLRFAHQSSVVDDAKQEPGQHEA
jgi:hypothetical protein